MEDEEPKIQNKNKWLYPKDSFGKMERGIVNDLGTSKSHSEREKK